jgi:hypothetical protein
MRPVRPLFGWLQALPLGHETTTYPLPISLLFPSPLQDYLVSGVICKFTRVLMPFSWYRNITLSSKRSQISLGLLFFLTRSMDCFLLLQRFVCPVKLLPYQNGTQLFRWATSDSLPPIFHYLLPNIFSCSWNQVLWDNNTRNLVIPLSKPLLRSFRNPCQRQMLYTPYPKGRIAYAVTSKPH